MKRPLTVIVPFRNEQDNIGPCIDSFLGLADEVLIACSAANALVQEIAANYDKIRVITGDESTTSDFNHWAVPHSKNEWILLVKSNERVTDDLSEEIEMLLNRGPTVNGYWIARDNHFMGQPLHWGISRNDSELRLFNRNIFAREQNRESKGESGRRLFGDSPLFDRNSNSSLFTNGESGGTEDSGISEIGKTESLKGRIKHFGINNYDELFLALHRTTSSQAENWHHENSESRYSRLMLGPVFQFFREYIWRGGIFDGKAGLQLAWMSAFQSFAAQARLWELNHGQSSNECDIPTHENGSEAVLRDQRSDHRRAA